MYNEAVLDIVRNAIMLTLKIAGPVLIAGVVIGLVISIVQSITSIQDQALTFVPKIIVMLLVASAMLPWLVARLVAFTQELFLLHLN